MVGARCARKHKRDEDGWRKPDRRAFSWVYFSSTLAQLAMQPARTARKHPTVKHHEQGIGGHRVVTRRSVGKTSAPATILPVLSCDTGASVVFVKFMAGGPGFKAQARLSSASMGRCAAACLTLLPRRSVTPSAGNTHWACAHTLACGSASSRGHMGRSTRLAGWQQWAAVLFAVAWFKVQPIVEKVSTPNPIWQPESNLR